MTGDTEAHPVDIVDLEHLGHPLDLTMAGGAGVGTHGLDVTLMREMGVPGQVVNADPFDRLLLVPGLTQLSDLSLIGAIAAANYQMTSHAGLHRWYARLWRDIYRVMAVLTLDLVLPGVNVVPEEDGLTWSLEVPAVRRGND